MSTLLKRGNQFFVILGRMYPPNWDYWASVQGPLLDTIKMSILGSVIGALLAIPAAVIASYNMVVNRWVTGSMKLVLSLIRTVPTLIYASVLTLIFGIGTFAGTVAIAIFTFSFMAKQLYEMIETVDDIVNRTCGCFDGSLVTNYHRIFRRRFGLATDCDGRFSRCLRLQTYRSCTIGSRRSIYACSKRVFACRAVVVVVGFCLICAIYAIKMGLRRTSQLTVNNLDGFVVHLNVVFDFSIAVCFGINDNDNYIADYEIGRASCRERV